MGYEFGAIEAVGAVIFVGMSVDYCLHLAHGPLAVTMIWSERLVGTTRVTLIFCPLGHGGSPNSHEAHRPKLDTSKHVRHRHGLPAEGPMGQMGDYRVKLSEIETAAIGGFRLPEDRNEYVRPESVCWRALKEHGSLARLSFSQQGITD